MRTRAMMFPPGRMRPGMVRGFGPHALYGLDELDELGAAGQVYVAPVNATQAQLQQAASAQAAMPITVTAPAMGTVRTPTTQPAGGGIGGLLGNLATGGLGGLLGNVFGAGGPASVLGGLLGGPAQLLGGLLGQGVTQATGGGAATNPLASLIGAGLGGVAPGTGPLPGGLGQMVGQLLGFSGPGGTGFPPQDTAMMAAASQGYTPAQYTQMGQYTGQVGRAIVNRITGASLPELQAIRGMIEDRMAQIQATGEHRMLVSDDTFRRQVLGRLANISNQVATIGGGYASRF